MDYDASRYQRPRPAFGAWLLGQTRRGGLIGNLAEAATKDRGFPKGRSPEDVRARLRAVMAEGDMFEAVDDAEMAWAGAA